MINTLTIYTTELDDENKAIQDITSQLKFEHGIPQNVIGIITCHYEFILSGVYQAICKVLPFDTVGTISSAQSFHSQTDLLLLTILIISSDDVEFDIIKTESLIDSSPDIMVKNAYQTSKRESSKPALILTFSPFIPQNCGDVYVNALDEVSGGVPLFGTLAIDDTLDFSNCFMIHNGEYYKDRMAMVLIYGNIQPKFYVANMSESKIIGKSALITKSAGPVLMEVNNHHVMDYFIDLGLAKASEQQYAMVTIPFLLDYNDGTPKVSKIFVMLTENKHALCAGIMPEGSTIYMTKADEQDIINTTSLALDKMLPDFEKASVLLIYTCIARYLTLGALQFKEMELVKNRINNQLPYIMINSGGEICPTQVSDGKAINRFHNNTFVACLF